MHIPSQDAGLKGTQCVSATGTMRLLIRLRGNYHERYVSEVSEKKNVSRFRRKPPPFIIDFQYPSLPSGDDNLIHGSNGSLFT